MKTYYLRLDAQKRAVARFPYGTNLSRLQSMSDYLGQVDIATTQWNM